MSLTYQNMKRAVKIVIAAGNVPNIVGDAGIGKSALVAEIAKELHARLFTTVVSLAEKGDLAIPVPPLRDEAFIQTTQYGELANVKYGYSETLIQIIQQAEAYPDQPIIWFLDEFNRGTAAVQSELMNLVLQRQVNSLHLPNQVHIVLAENPDDSMGGFTETNYAVTPADAAIKDRTVRLVMQASLKDWLLWAKQTDKNGKSNIDPLVQKYLMTHESYLTGPKSDDLCPTPRSWQRVSQNLRQLLLLPANTQQQLMADIFSGDLGSEVGVAFAEYVLHHGQQITANDLVNKPITEMSEQFNSQTEADKVQLLTTLTAQNTSLFLDKDFIQRYIDYLNALSPDGRYAIIQEFAKVSRQHPELLEKGYDQANDDEVFAKFYQLVQKIAAL